MSIELRIHDADFERMLASATANGLQRAGVFLHTQCRLAVGKGNPRTRNATRVRGKRPGTTRRSKSFGYHSPSKPGEPPRKRTGFGQQNIVYEFNGDPKNPAVRVGVRRNALYMFWLEVGTRHIRPRPWLLATLIKFKDQLGRLAALGR